MGMLVLLACGASPAPSQAISPAEALRTSPQLTEARKLAPQAFAEGEGALAAAKRAEADGDVVMADLLAERATAHYVRAVAMGRRARAAAIEADVGAKLGRLEEERARLTEARAGLERETEDLEKRLRIAKEAALPSPSKKDSPAREAARLVAARSFLAEARLLCGAAHLVAGKTAELEAADLEIEALEKQLDAPRPRADAPTPIDAATRQRARCLGLLTRAQRDVTASVGEDASLADLSQAGLSPSRDERGVYVTLRPEWNGDKLPPGSEKTFATLARIALAQKASIQLVIHDGSSRDKDLGVRRAAASRDALTRSGLAAARIRAENASSRLPIADPAGEKALDRNARIDVVFIRGK